MFKLIGFISGYYFFGLFGALFGLFVGALIDRMRAYGAGGINPLQNPLRQTVFLETLFISMGKLGKADGQISAGETAHAEAFMQKLGMTAEQLNVQFIRFQFRDFRAKAASDIESMAQARKLLGHTTEDMTRNYVRARIGERVSPVMAK